jgi:hypothetical protein
VRIGGSYYYAPHGVIGQPDGHYCLTDLCDVAGADMQSHGIVKLLENAA